MKFISILFLISFFFLASCARKVAVHPTELFHYGQFAYMQDASGRWFVVTTNSKDLNEAMKHIQPGPASVDKLDLWIITPLTPQPGIRSTSPNSRAVH